jgi:hypothetical protein
MMEMLFKFNGREFPCQEDFWDDRRFSGLPTFTFRQVGVRSVEFQALPGSEARALRGKTIRHASFLGPGGQALLSLRTGGFRCRGARRGARWTRLILRKHGRIFDWIFFPPMLFPRNPAKGGTSGPQACFLAGKRIAKVKVGKDFRDSPRKCCLKEGPGI